ncbi:hypothetical protein SAMN04488109_0653 [Chryseolinea serpens]|uniref:Fibronectin type-III domain-containing protein n=1 Tax=Chryseolinea serpens TaxID=947013 RepID=A0A1M5KJG1_9BACT|nr:hypothetical protein [Chryseolinea serpens]SHG52313.1 hypothetical protein SAMN04488109_0653 [Chryseolinea serpens]
MKTLLVNFLCLLMLTAMFLGACNSNEVDPVTTDAVTRDSVPDIDEFVDVDDSLNLTVIDFDTQRPVADMQVFLTTVHFGNGTVTFSDVTPLGISDKCGRVSGPAPRALAWSTAHGYIDSTHFVLLFRGITYGDFYDAVEIGESNKEIMAKRPLVYNFKTTVDRSVPSVRLDWTTRATPWGTYSANGGVQPNYYTIPWGKKIHVWRQTMNSTAWMKEIFSVDFVDGRNETFTDLTASPDSTYLYIVSPYNDAGTSLGAPEVTIDMKTSTGTTTWLPRASTCN